MQIRTQLTALQGSAGLKDAPQSVRDSVAALTKQVTGVQTHLTEGRRSAGTQAAAATQTPAPTTPTAETPPGETAPWEIM